MLNSINDAINRGVAWFDVVGINSPKRGFYKSSFGTQLYRYIEVSNAE
jgi:lipid II:glycine glycyltransferase (peptidoglycan interpeptide bridge formation enzyme)